MNEMLQVDRRVIVAEIVPGNYLWCNWSMWIPGEDPKKLNRPTNRYIIHVVYIVLIVSFSY